MIRTVSKAIVVTLIGLIGVVALFGLAGARINTTASFPYGLYWVVHAPVKKGEMVMFCPGQGDAFREARARGYIGAGYCPGGYGFILKEIVGAQGDRVAITSRGVFVDKRLLANSKPDDRDPAGRPLPRLRGRFTLKRGQVLVMSSYNPLSFDSRYFGPINRSQIRNVVRPILTWASYP